MSGLGHFYTPDQEEQNMVKGCLSMVLLIAVGVIFVMLMFMLAAFF